MVMLTVIMVVMVMMIMAVGIVSRNTSQAVQSQNIVEQIKAEQLAKGAYWLWYTEKNGGAELPNFTEDIDGKTYTVTFADPGGAGPNDTDARSVQVSY
jgi:uncharacterized membrane protein